MGGHTLRLPEAYQEFYRREWRPAVALAYALCADRAVAEEIAQDSLVVAYRKWETVSAYDLPGAWLRRVVVHKATSVLRRRTTEARALVRWRQRNDRRGIGVPDADERMWRLVAALPRRQAQAIALHYLDDLDSRQIAAILDCAEATVRVHLHRGRLTLGRQLRTVEEDG